MEGFLEPGGFRMAIQLTAASLYVIFSIPYPLAMWSVLGMPHNGHHGPDLTPMDFFLSGYLMDKIYQTAPPNLQDLRQRITREVIVLDHVHFVREVFDAMRARAQICLELYGARFEGRARTVYT